MLCFESGSKAVRLANAIKGVLEVISVHTCTAKRTGSSDQCVLQHFELAPSHSLLNHRAATTLYFKI